MKDADEGGQASDGAASEVSSPPASVHDSADDESDLSDVPPDYEDDIPPTLMFPNLRRSVEAGTATGTGAANSPAESSEEASDGGDATEEEEGADDSQAEAEVEDGDETEIEGTGAEGGEDTEAGVE